MTKKNWGVQIFRHLKFGQWMFLVFAILSLIVNIGMFAVNGVVTIYSYVTFVVLMTLTFLFDKIERYRFENSTSDEISKLNRIEQGLQYLGESHDTVEWFCNNSVGLSSISNTVFFRIATADLIHVNYQLPVYENRIKEILKSDNCHWKDLVTRDQLPVIRNFCNGLDSEQLGKHSFKVLETDLPLLQMLIMRYRDRSRPPVVLLGWGFLAGKWQMYICLTARRLLTIFRIILTNFSQELRHPNMRRFRHDRSNLKRRN